MKKIILIYITTIFLSVNLFAVEKKNCKEFEKFGIGSKKYLKCQTLNLDKKKFKLKTDSKLTDIMTGKEKVKTPDVTGILGKLGKAFKPDLEPYKNLGKKKKIEKLGK